MTYLHSLSSVRRASFAAALALTCFCAVAAAQTSSPDPDGRVFDDGPSGTPCDSPRGLPCDRTPPHLVGLADPQQWSAVGRGSHRTLYRRATAQERKANGWSVGAFLVAGPGAAEATLGADKTTLMIPLADDKVQPIVFELSQRVEGLEFYERIGVPGSPDGAVQSRKLTPTLFEYFNQGFDPRRLGPVNGAWATIVSSEDGLFASGLAGGFEVELDGPNAGWKLDRLPAPGGPAPNPGNVVKVQVLSLGAYGGAQYNACQGNFGSPACNWLCAEVPGAPCDSNPHLNPRRATTASTA